MREAPQTEPSRRYEIVTEEKADGATYTPKILADFVAEKIVESMGMERRKEPLRLFDPAIGDGELLVSLLGQLEKRGAGIVEVYGFETNPSALEEARRRIKIQFPGVRVQFRNENFLAFVLERFGSDGTGSLFLSEANDFPEVYDLIIANPPYVRTQIMGAGQAQMLAEQFGLSGRVDLYYAFILGMGRVLRSQGIAGIIVSNRFMTTKSGACIRRALLNQFNLLHVWDLGDTKLFEAAVLPSVLLMEGKNGQRVETPAFTAIYQSADAAKEVACDPIDALSKEGIVGISDGRCFRVQKGKLETGGTQEGVWRIATKAGAEWLATVKGHSWGTFGDIGKIRVGVKTCADAVFIRSDWKEIGKGEVPELLRRLTTHHIARRFKPLCAEKGRAILYPHEVSAGRRRPVAIEAYPRSRAYLEAHREVLRNRKYLIEAGRAWYEVWVPQDPDAWDVQKLIFRDIAEEPTFWIDQDRSVVNGDCYWMICEKSANIDLLWLAAAVGNSTFIERFYDYCFHNKLYAGRRRFMTQYVEKFPLPDPVGVLGKAIIAKAKAIYECIPSEKADELYEDLNRMVWEAFGLVVEEVSG